MAVPLTSSRLVTLGSVCRTLVFGFSPASAPASAWKKYAQNVRLSVVPISKKRGQNRRTPRGACEESISGGRAISMIWSHCEFQGVLPSSTFFTSIGVGGADLTAWACEAVGTAMQNVRHAMNQGVFNTK